MISKTNQKLAHELVAETAKEFAGVFYEEAACESDDFFHYYPDQKDFVAREWPRFVETARLQLSKMLGQPNVNEVQKEIIFEALLKHSSLPGNVDKRVSNETIRSLH